MFATFAFAFGIMALVVGGMAIGVILAGRTIKGSCGGLNAVAGADKCLVCSKPVDPDSPLHDKLACRRTCRKAQALRAAADREAARAPAPSG